ncbi:MAG: PilZ domain-containing protein [Deltaproteobacteria bacterium]|nr:PilZ domain-containing protein [Deltaproteobacteria bacterium]
MTQDETGSDRREFPRLDARVDVSMTFLADKDAIRQNFQSENLSLGGICMQTDQPVEQGAFVAVELNLPGGEETADLFAEVVWARPEGKDSYLLGLRFIASSDDSLMNLGRFLEPELSQ